MVLNLLPLPPLDGGRVLVSVLPPRAAIAVSKVEPYGLIILIVLLATNVLGMILWPPLSLAIGALSSLSGLSAAEFQTLLMSLLGG